MSDAVLSASPAARARPAGLKALVQSLLINILGPYIVFTMAEPHFPVGSTTPLLLSALAPAAEFIILYWRQRVVDVIAIISLIQLVGGVAITILAHTAHGAIVGHALMPGAEGLVFAVSILIGQPLLRPLARQAMAGSDHQRQARFDEISKRTGARRVFVRLTWVWAVTLCLNSAILLAAAYTLSNARYVLISTIVTYGILALLIWGGIRYGRRAVSATINLDQAAPAPRG